MGDQGDHFSRVCEAKLSGHCFHSIEDKNIFLQFSQIRNEKNKLLFQK